MAMDNAKMNKAGTIRKVLSYMKRYIPLLVISLALSVVTVALTLYFPILTGRAIDLIVGKGKVDFTAMTAILTRAAIIVVIAAAAQWLTNICNNRMTYNIVRDIRRDAFLNIEKMPLSYIDSHSHGDMVSRIIADVDTFSEGLLMGFTQLFTGIATIAGTLIFMLTIDVKISCIVVLITPLSLFVASFITKKTYSMFQLQTRTRGEQTSLIDEIVGNEKVGILDADITGPSIPKMFGAHDQIIGDENGLMHPYETKEGIKLISVNLLMDNEEDPVIWRGPVIAGVVKQFWNETAWGDIDYLFVDMPPGTGDVPLTVFQSLPVDGIVIVTSPQELVNMIVKKAYNMAEAMHITVLGVVENFSYLKCPDCGKEIKLFGESHIDEIAKELSVPVLGKLPLDTSYAAIADKGDFYSIENDHLAKATEVLERI